MARPSSVLLELHSEFERPRFPRRRTVKKLNLKGECSGQYSGRETPFRHFSSISNYSARNTPHATSIEASKVITQTDVIIEKPSYSPPLRARSVQRKHRAKINQQTESPTEKMSKVQEKYGVEYKQMLKAHGINVEKEGLKEVIRKSKDVFNGTYSVKYFGIMDSQLGVVSQRLPLAPKGREQTRANSPNSSRTVKFYYQEAAASKLDAIRKETDSIVVSGNGWNNTNQFHSLIREDSYEELVSHAMNKDRGANQKEKQILQESEFSLMNLQDQKTPNQAENLQTERVKFKLVPARPKDVLGVATEGDDLINARLDINILSERQKTLLSERNLKGNSSRKILGSTERLTSPLPAGEGNNNSFPRKIKSVRRLRPKLKEENSPVNKSGVSGQKKINPEDWQRELSQLREAQQWREAQQLKSRKNVVNIEPNKRKEYIDEFNVPEKFRSHEVKALTSSRASYSYSKLLKTINTKERPEENLARTTKQLYEINIKREEMKQAHAQAMNENLRSERKKSQSPRGSPVLDGDENKLISTRGPFCIKISQPTSVNTLYNTFTKIKEKVKTESNLNVSKSVLFVMPTK